MKNIFRVCFLCFILFGFSGCKQIVETTPTTTGYLITWKGSFETVPSEPEAGWAYYNTTTKKSYIYDGNSWQILAQDGADNSIDDETNNIKDNSFVFMGESFEEIDGIIYNVKSYASVYALEPYFYTYYKYYYLNNKLRRAYVIYHNHGADLDYTYLEFVEHRCNYCSSYIYIYNENGKLVENIQQPSDSSGKNYDYKTVIYYDSYGNKYSAKSYFKNEGPTCETIFDSNGNKREYLNYETSVFPSYISSKYTYYEDGKEESYIYYDSLGIETSKNYYTYYDNGIKKTQTQYSNGKISNEYSYYLNGITLLSVSYNSDEDFYRFYYNYPSGYTQFYYNGEYLYSYQDGKTKNQSTNSNDYESKITYTHEQAQTKLLELKGQI